MNTKVCFLFIFAFLYLTNSYLQVARRSCSHQHHPRQATSHFPPFNSYLVSQRFLGLQAEAVEKQAQRSVCHLGLRYDFFFGWGVFIDYFYLLRSINLYYNEDDGRVEEIDQEESDQMTIAPVCFFFFFSSSSTYLFFFLGFLNFYYNDDCTVPKKRKRQF